MAQAIGRSMAPLVETERYLWLNLSCIKDRDRTFILDASLSPTGLFGNPVSLIVERFQEAKRQSAAFSSLAALGPVGRQPPAPHTVKNSKRVLLLERLNPLGDIKAWKLLPNISQWALHTLEQGYRIQFSLNHLWWEKQKCSPCWQRRPQNVFLLPSLGSKASTT